jgi:CRP-like cAMP-binding protein
VKTGSSFGELALLYSSTRAATVIAGSSSTDTDTNNNLTTVLRVDKHTFRRHILRSQTISLTETKKQLLQDVPFLKDLNDSYIKKLMRHMTPVFYNSGDIAATKGTIGDKFFIIQDGQFVCKDIIVGNKSYEDLYLGPGDYFGERSLITSEPRVANVVCITKGVTLTIDKQTFEKVLGKMSDIIMHAQDIRILGGLPFIHKSLLNDDQLEALSGKVFNKTYSKGEIIFNTGDNVQARIFIVRKGQVIVQSTTDGTDTEIISPGGYFGERTAQMALQNVDGYTIAVLLLPIRRQFGLY